MFSLSDGPEQSLEGCQDAEGLTGERVRWWHCTHLNAWWFAIDPGEAGLPQQPWTPWLPCVTSAHLHHWRTCADIQSFLLVFNAINFIPHMFSWTVEKMLQFLFAKKALWWFLPSCLCAFWHLQFIYVFLNRRTWKCPQNYPSVHLG